MPATPGVAEAPPQPPPPDFKTSEVLAYGGKPERTPQQLRTAQERASQLQEFKKSNSPARDTFEWYKNRPNEVRFSQIDSENLQLQFGLGGAKREQNGSITGPQEGEEKAIFEEAQKTVKGLSDYLRYSEIQLEAKQTGKDISRVLGEKGVSSQDFLRMRENGLKLLAEHEAVNQMFPELSELSPTEKADYLEATLALDPKLRARIGEQLRYAAEKAKNLPGAKKDPELEEAKKTKDAATQKKQEGLESITQQMEDLNMPLPDEVRERVQKLIDEGRSVDTVTTYLRGALINEQTIPELKAITQYLSAKNSLEALERDLAGMDTRKTPEGLLANKQQSYESAQQVIANFESRAQTDPALKAQFEKYADLSRALISQKDQSGLYLSPVAEAIGETIKAKQQIDKADKTINAKQAEATTQDKEWRAQRLQQESELILELDNILPTAIGGVMAERYDEMVHLENERREKTATKAEEEKGKKIADGIRAVGKAANERWIKFDEKSRQKQINHKQIGEDVRFLAYRGEEGVKRLILRELGFEPPVIPGSRPSVIGEPRRIDYKTVDLSTLTDEQKQILEEVYSTEGAALKTKLFADFTMTGKERDLRWNNKNELKLKDHEWELLGQHFGDALSQETTTTPGSANTQQTIDALKKTIGVLDKKKKVIIPLMFLGLFIKEIIGGMVG